jgi:serine/threonine-protein phosphatase 2A regulatory subunit B'
VSAGPSSSAAIGMSRSGSSDSGNLAPSGQAGGGTSPTGSGNGGLTPGAAGGGPAQGQGQGAGQAGPTTPRRSPVSDKTSPAPPLVVISGAHNSEMPSDPIPHSPLGRAFGSPERLLGPDGQPTPPRAGPLNRLRGTPKDTIPIVGKTPRKQRSSRFYVTEKVDIEKLPNFLGTSASYIWPYRPNELRSALYLGHSALDVSNELTQQMSGQMTGTSCSSRSCTSVEWCLTLTMPVRT